MLCTICGQAEPAPGTATVTLERGSATIVVKHVPAQVCPNCHEEYVSDDVAARLLATAEEAARRGVGVDVREYAA